MRLRVSEERIKQLQDRHIEPIFQAAMLLMKEAKRNQFLDYRPLKDQLRFHRSPAQIRAFIGGNRSGKTTAGVMEAIWYSLGRHPYRTILAPNHGWIVGLDTEMVEDVILPKFWDYLPEREIRRFNRNTKVLELTNGSVIKFKSCESGAKKFQSAECRWIWFDEEPPKEVWDEAQVRVGSRWPLDTWITMTPLNGMDWSWDEIIQREKPGFLEVFSASMLANTYIPEAERRRLQEQWKGKPEELARLHGRYFSKSGLIYPALREETHRIEPFPIPKEWPWARCIDPHGRKPSAVVWMAISPKNEYYIADEFQSDREILFSELAEEIKSRDAGRRIIRSLIDPSSRARNMITGTSIKEELQRHGVYAVEAKNDLVAGWDAVRSRLSTPEGPKLFVFRSCPKTWSSLAGLTYDDWRFRESTRDPKEAQRQRNSDLADCVRYLCLENLVGDLSEEEWDGLFERYRPVGYSGYR